MRLAKRTISVVLLILMLCTGVTAQEVKYSANSGVYDTLKSITFDDMAYMPVNHWSGVAVYTVAAAGLIKGYESNFMPSGTVTRSEALAVLFRSSGEEKIAASYYSNVVKEKEMHPEKYNNIDSWADGYIRLAVDHGILTPDDYIYCMSSNYNSDGVFQKDKPALKAELAKWIVKVYKLPLQKGEEKISKFYDYSQLKPEDKPYLETAVYYGVLNGSGDELDPYVTMTREQMAQMFYNIRALWAEKLGYTIINTSVSEIIKDTVQGEGKITNNINIVTDAGTLVTQREYKLNGEAIDNTATEGFLYNDFVVIAKDHLPTDCTILKKSDWISLFEKDNEIKFVLKDKSAGGRNFSSAEYKDSSVYKGKLYFVDSSEMTMVLETQDGFKEIEYAVDTEFAYRTENVLHDKVNEAYKDRNVYVFTCASVADKREFAYRVQITD